MIQYRAYARTAFQGADINGDAVTMPPWSMRDGGVVKDFTIEQANTLLHNSFRQD
jgi:hypothetical protein